MSPAARLLTNSYLNATKEHLRKQSALIEFDLDCDRDIVFDQKPRIVGIDRCFDAIIFCQGLRIARKQLVSRFAPSPSPWRYYSGFQPQAHFLTDHVIHHSAWVVPDRNKELLLGATYDRMTLDGIVDDRASVLDAKTTLVNRFREYWPPFNNLPIDILDHRAAVRPASYDRHPLIGRHKTHGSLFC